MEIKKLADRKILTSYPLLFDSVDSAPIISNGLEVEPGWYVLVYETLGLLNDLVMGRSSDPIINQVKQVSGILEIIFTQSRPFFEIEMLRIVSRFLSSEVCDICGAIGLYRPIDSDFFSRCEDHIASVDNFNRQELRRKVLSDFISYRRQGLKTQGLIYIDVSQSPHDSKHGTISINNFPRILRSIQDGLENKFCSFEYDGVNHLVASELIFSAKQNGRKLIFGTDRSSFSNLVLSNIHR
ncbi:MULTISPECIES: hypothetical protein [unclassified Marinobacter]|jgi:hypothetical protein|uniref:hypothetical protein n=1 Tax=unclassified Marinobacter TaxID=83889 RepID=UPI00257C4CBC|nr:MULTISPECIES: hypothetical protein [unclassified Marinobacter]|tara:strand:- start:3300 stop:4019 length:720 start_codon:yes stop_codon:yes gene_type:complete